MSSVLNRLNALSSVAMYALTTVALSAFLTTHFLPMEYPSTFKLNKLMVRNIQEFETRASRNDVANLVFDLEFDTGPIWNWNTKQLFLYVVAEYQTEKNDINRVVIWDKIILKKDIEKAKSTVVKYKNVKNKYYFFDDGAGLLNNQEVKFYLSYNVIANNGYFWLKTHEPSAKTYAMPDSYQVNKFY